MCEDLNTNIQAKTWTRTMQTINKIGYSEGASDGQAGTFQPSFDSGYKLGLEFGLELGFNEVASSILQNVDSNAAKIQIKDPQSINCQICTNANGTTSQEIDSNNFIKEKNIPYG